MSFPRRSKAPVIAELQAMLRTVLPELGLSQDGLYGEQTKAAIQAFQRKNGLPDNGVTDLATWEALVAADQRESILRGPAEPLNIILQPGQVICAKSDNLHLYLIQAMMKALTRLYSNFPPVSITGLLDEQTSKAVICIQHCAGLPMTGEIDKMTWMFLAHLYRLAVGDGSGSFPCRETPACPDARNESS